LVAADRFEGGIMFRNKTVFLLGAGASWHYGYPTGEQLVREVVIRAHMLREFFEQSVSPLNVYLPKLVEEKIVSPASTQNIAAAWKAATNECNQLANRLTQVDPLLIDYFLGQNPQLQSIGRLLIAWVILECDSKFRQSRRNQNRDRSDRNDNWYRFIIHKLVKDCTKSSDLLLNNVTFITFNYDFSLEQEVYKSVSSIEMFEQEDVKKFFTDDRVIHVYGTVRECPPIVRPINFEVHSNQPEYHDDLPARQKDYKDFLDEVFEASKTIQVIDPYDKHKDEKKIKSAQDAISNAQVLFILGYGFDENNSIRLDLRRHLAHPKPKAILFTNFRDINQVNKKAAQLLLGSAGGFMPPNPPIMGNFQEGWYYEKSVRDVYQAMELDFDSLEERLLRSSNL
jgi:hypothetical protein